MLRIKAAKTKGAYGIGMFMPRMERISNVTTIAIVERRMRNFLSFNGKFIFSMDFNNGQYIFRFVNLFKWRKLYIATINNRKYLFKRF